MNQTETSKLFIYFIDIFYKNKYNSFINKLYYIGGIEMKFSNRLLLFLAGVVFVLLGLFLFTNPVANLVAYSWWIAFGLLVSSIAAILGYFSVPKELRSPAHLFQGIVNLLLALYLVAYGFVTLPVVIPTILGIWLIVEAIIVFFKGNRLGLIFPIIGNHIMWIALLAFLLGLVILFNPVATSVFVVYVVAFAFLIVGFTYILDAFRK
ncbi:acid-resistance membrane protein [Streptococcus gordonii]|nr:acid-resistance membrane protein [Streptococcus gordonii]RSJ61329.1 acid-resistance membrane protein [Streptococcus gordonii]